MLYIIAYDTKMILKFYFFQFFNNFFPVRLEQMRICVHSHFYIIMPQTFRNHKRVRTKVDQQTGVRVPEIMHPDRAQVDLLAYSCECFTEPHTGPGEKPVIWIHTVDLRHVVFNFIQKKLRYIYDPVAFRCLGWLYGVFAVYICQCFVDRNLLFLKINISRSKTGSQKL